MLRRLPSSLLALVTVSALAMATTACRHPYSGSPERLSKPRPKEPPENTEVTEPLAEVALDEQCRTNFFAEPAALKQESKLIKESRSKGQEADRILLEAEKADMNQRVPVVRDAIVRLSNTLRKYPYGPLPTYKLAVAYALVNRKGCALALLERLGKLQEYEPVAKEATRMVQLAVRDLAFTAFEKEATAALGE